MNPQYEKIGVQELALSPETYRGRKVSLSGEVIGVQKTVDGHMVHLEIPFADGFLRGTEMVVAEYAGEVSELLPGRIVIARGTCDDVQVISRDDCCGLIVVPRIKAESLEVV